MKDVLSVSIILFSIALVVGITSVVSKNIFYKALESTDTYVLKDIVTNDIPVNSEVKSVFSKPFNDESVKVEVSFYNTSSTAEEQERSLLLYDNTYMPSTGILYSCEKQFDILAPMEGTIESIDEDETFGYIITIKHTNNIITKYSSVKDIKVNVGDTVNTGEIIATSNSNKITSVSNNMLLFELIYDGSYVNPEDYYDKEIGSMN